MVAYALTEQDKINGKPGGGVIPHRPSLLLPNVNGKDILEFGNKKNDSGLYRDVYLASGAKSYHCVDLNGEDGAIPIDLRSETSYEQICEATGIDKFDIVTNFGTSEHIPVQRTFYKCVHKLTKVGGHMIHWTPVQERFIEHGIHGSIWHMNFDFFDLLAAANPSYNIDIPWTDTCDRIGSARIQLVEDSEFVWPEGYADGWYNETWERSHWATKFIKENPDNWKEQLFKPIP